MSNGESWWRDLQPFDDGLETCERCGERTDEIFEDADLNHVCEGCLNGVDEDFLREMLQ